MSKKEKNSIRVLGNRLNIELWLGIGFFLCLLVFVLHSVQEKGMAFGRVVAVSDDHLVTWVAHVPNTFEDMELVTIDYENDIAYYRYVGDKVTPEVGDTVYLYSGSPVNVTSVTDTYFTVYSEEPGAFYSGLSNTPVTWGDGTIIGYVSTLLENGHCRCIWR